MRCPTLNDLPPPPPGKTGWPWTEESPQLPDRMPDGGPWPRISIVTPSYNQGQFIEETIRSVLLQGYPDLEYIIIDGGSADDSVEIIRKYEPWLAYWVSERDGGQAHAINKGFSRASGQIYYYLNSDDLIYLNTVYHIAPYFLKSEDPILLCCSGEFFGPAVDDVFGAREEKGCGVIRSWVPASKQRLTDWLGTCASIFQQSTFWDSRIYDQLGGFREDLDFCFDKDFFLRGIFEMKNYKPYPAIIAAGHRLHGNCKTVTIPDVMINENNRIADEYFKKSWCQKILLQERKEKVSYEFMVNSLNKSDLFLRIRSLLISIYFWPEILKSRMFWGAVRRVFYKPSIDK